MRVAVRLRLCYVANITRLGDPIRPRIGLYLVRSRRIDHLLTDVITLSSVAAIVRRGGGERGEI